MPRFTIRRNKNPQELNVFFLDQNRRNFTPQKLPVIRYINDPDIFVEQKASNTQGDQLSSSQTTASCDISSLCSDTIER